MRDADLLLCISVTFLLAFDVTALPLHDSVVFVFPYESRLASAKKNNIEQFVYSVRATSTGMYM